jgi:hypothetical protein
MKNFKFLLAGAIIAMFSCRCYAASSPSSKEMLKRAGEKTANFAKSSAKVVITGDTTKLQNFAAKKLTQAGVDQRSAEKFVRGAAKMRKCATNAAAKRLIGISPDDIRGLAKKALSAARGEDDSYEEGGPTEAAPTAKETGFVTKDDLGEIIGEALVKFSEQYHLAEILSDYINRLHSMPASADEEVVHSQEEDATYPMEEPPPAEEQLELEVDAPKETRQVGESEFDALHDWVQGNIDL